MALQRNLILLLAAMTLLGFGVRVYVAFRPLETLIGWTLYDDAFYYFGIAQHIVAGDGSTFDGVNATNGYHPLWMLLNVFAFSLFESYEHSIRSLLLISLMLDLATGAVVALLAFLLTKDTLITPILAALWLFNHRIIYATLNGLETALSMFAISLTFLAFYFVLKDSSTKRLALFGGACGFAVLARTDNVVLIALLVALMVVIVRRARVLIVLPITAGMLLPWVIWNWATFQSIIQDSTIALKGFEIARIAAADQSVWSFATNTLVPMYLHSVRLLYVVSGLPVGGYLIATALWTALVAVFSLAHLRRWWIDADPPRRWLVVALVSWPLLLIGVHVFWRWGFRPHYLSSTFISILIPYSTALLLLVRSSSVLKRALVVVVLPLMIVSYAQVKELLPYHLQHQQEMLRAAEWLNTACPDECSTVGSLNAGIIGFYYEGRVVNLDGSVNSAAVSAIYDRSLGAYVQREGIVFLADLDRALDLDHPVWGWGDDPPLTVAYDQQTSHPTHRYVIYRWDE